MILNKDKRDSMKFNDYQYTRPNMEQVETDINHAIEKFKNAASFKEQDVAMKEINELRNTVDTAFNICYIRHTIDTNDEFYQQEQDNLVH